MHIKTRQVKCACTGGHHFRYEGEILSTITIGMYIQICTKCGAYEKRKIGSGVINPVRIYQGPRSGMYEYWQSHHD